MKISRLNAAYDILSKTLKLPIDKDKIKLLRKNNLSLRKIASIVGVSWSTVQRIVKS